MVLISEWKRLVREMARQWDNHGIVMDLPSGTVISHRDIATWNAMEKNEPIYRCFTN